MHTNRPAASAAHQVQCKQTKCESI